MLVPIRIGKTEGVGHFSFIQGSTFRCKIATLNVSMLFNIIAPFMNCVTHK